MFASNTHLAAKLKCTTDLESQLLLTKDTSPALQTYLADPTKPPKASIPSWGFKGASDKSKHIFGYLSSAKRDSLPTIRLGSMDGSWNPLSEDVIKQDSKLRKHANELLTTHESLHLITEALKLGTKFSSKTSISQVKRYLEGLASFAENTRNRLESPALTAVHEAVLNTQKTRNFQIRGMAPAPVTNELKDSPIIHEEKHLFPEQSLKKADALASQHFRDFKPAYGSSRNKKFPNKNYPQHRNFRPSSREASAFHPPRPQESNPLTSYRGRPQHTASTSRQPNPHHSLQEFSAPSFLSQPRGTSLRGRTRGNPSARFPPRGNPYSYRSAPQPTRGQYQTFRPRGAPYTRPNAGRRGIYNPRGSNPSFKPAYAGQQ